MPRLVLHKSNGKAFNLTHVSHVEMLSQEPFLRRLYVEQKRTERSRRRFVLMLLKSGSLLTNGNGSKAATLDRIVDALSKSTRETDIMGWYKEGTVIGTVFTEIGSEEGHAVAKALLGKLTGALSSALSIEQINEITLSFHVFPEDWEDHSNGNGNSNGIPKTSILCPDPELASGPTKGTLWIKRVMDVAGSIAALAVFSPLMLAIAAAIKLTSKGPVVFRQQRVGQHGRPFTFLKFRSMRPANDARAHQEFVTQLIKGGNGIPQNGPQKTVFKMTNDPRITAVGRFIRRTSLDELPQFFNVLLGDMSLVGPRPPIPYECSSYDIWHRRRLLAVKPGITGLWQVTARSRVGFADMVRLDLKYAQSHSLWLDLKILLRTPGAVLGGDGAH